MRTQTYQIPGNPIPLARPRFGQGRVWDEQKALKFNAGLAISNQHGQQPLFSGPLSLTVTFYLPTPKAHKKWIGHYHHYKPDLDNLIKFIGDISNTILYNDDATISIITAIKKYDQNPRTEFTITELS